MGGRDENAVTQGVRRKKQNLGSGNPCKKAAIEGKEREQRLAQGDCRIREKGIVHGDQGKRTCESLIFPDGPSFPCLLGHTQSRSMNDISHTPNTDQVVKPLQGLQWRARAGGSLWFQGQGTPPGRTPIPGVPKKDLGGVSGLPW